MKKLLLFTFLLPLFAFAQKDTTHVQTHYQNGKVNEEYVLNKDGNRDGAYIRKTRNGKNYIKGQYSNGQPTGIWEYYASDTTGELVEKLDFDSHKELFVDKYRVPSLICGPRFFGGSMIEQEYIQNHIKSDFTADERTAMAGQRYTVSFVIDSTTLKVISGSVMVNEKEVTPAVNDRLVKAVQDMPSWLAPICHGEGEVWRFSVTFVF